MHIALAGPRAAAATSRSASPPWREALAEPAAPAPRTRADSRYPRDRLLFAGRTVSPAFDRRPDGRSESLRGRHEPRSSAPDRSPTPKIGPALRLFVDR